jgi:hypothetical protein
MKRLSVLFLACAVMCVATSGALAQKKNGSMPGGVVVNVVAFEAMVEGIDYQKRTVTLKGPAGNEKTFTAGKAVRNFDQIKKGDKVKVESLEQVAVVVRKASEPPMAGEVTTIGVAPKGKKPGFVDVTTTEMTANVQAINYKKRTITLKGPEGNVMTYRVDKSVARFAEVKKGDQVVLKVTDALAITVTKH